jgi:hypothetical protein
MTNLNITYKYVDDKSDNLITKTIEINKSLLLNKEDFKKETFLNFEEISFLIKENKTLPLKHIAKKIFEVHWYDIYYYLEYIEDFLGNEDLDFEIVFDFKESSRKTLSLHKNLETLIDIIETIGLDIIEKKHVRLGIIDDKKSFTRLIAPKNYNGKNDARRKIMESM